MKKVVYVVESFGAGVYTFLSELSNIIIENYELVIIYSVRQETPINFRDDFNKGIKFIYIDMCRGLNPYKNIKSLITLKKVLKSENPDIIHLHSSKAGFLGRLACYANKFDMEKVFYNPHGFSFLQQNEFKFKRKLFYLLEKFANRLGGYTVACSNGEFEETLKISNKCININNGIDTKKIDEIIEENNLNLTYEKTNKAVKIGTIGRICYQKNPEIFNEIAKHFKDYDFIWIGDGELKDILSSGNIKVTGWAKREEVIKELGDIDIFILTSLWEGLPIALLESMYFGKIVIVSNVIGNRDVVNNNINGYIANNLEDYIKIIDYIISNNIIRDTKFKEKVKLSILEDYEITQMAKKYIDLYERKSPYKILHLFSNKTLSGAEKVALDICTNLDKDIFTPIAVCAGDELGGYFERNDIRSFKININSLNPIEILKLRRLLKNENVKLIHAHDVRASIAAKLASNNLNISVISHIHVEYDWLKTNSILKHIDRVFRNKYNLSIACSSKVKEFYCQHNSKCSIDKIVSLANSFNFSEFNKIQIEDALDLKSKNNIRNDKYIFGYIGRLISEKGLELLIEGFNLFDKKYPGCSVLLIVGAGVEKENLMGLAKKYDLLEKIYFMGYRKDIYNWLNIFDLFILPSKREGLPITILEAMAMRKIVISTAVGGIPELITNNYNGILIEQRSPELLMRSMEYVYINKDEVNDIVQNAYEYLKLNYNIDDYINRLSKIYMRLL